MATFHIGVSNPEEYGDYFAFGETKPKVEYTEENYILYGIPHGEAYIGIGKIISGTECGYYWTGSFSNEDCHWDAMCLQFDEFELDHYSSYAQPDKGLVIRPVTKLIDFGRRFSLYYKTKN